MVASYFRGSQRRFERNLLMPVLEATAACAALVALRLLRWQLRQVMRRRPAVATPPRHPFADGERDLVDECSWESFPASDPPAFNAR